MGLVSTQLGCLIAHISFGNYEFSHKIGKRLLIGINKCGGDDIRSHLDALEPYLYIKDKY